MSLYDGLGVDTDSKKSVTATGNKPDVSGWSAGIRMMQSQLRLKKAALTEAQRKIRGATMAPVVDLKKGPKPEEEMVSPQRLHLSPRRPILEPPRTVKPSPFLRDAPVVGNVVEEYDPAYPNEYEKVLRKVREKRQKKRELEWEKDKEKGDRRRRDRGDRGRDRDRHTRDRERSPQGFSRKPESEDEEDRDRERPRRKGKQGAAIAPPSVLLEDGPKDGFVAPAPVSGASSKNRPYSNIMNKQEQDPERSTTPPPGSQFSEMEGMPLLPNPGSPAGSLEQGPGGFTIPVGMGVDSVAAKIMAKYGFKSGKGLGKKEQGISTALVVEKTSRRGGKIIEHNKDVDFDMPPPMLPLPKQPTPASEVSAVMKNPTKVVLLKNMVGPGEVDEDLQPETAEECTKYGDVVKCLIYECPQEMQPSFQSAPNAEEDEAVRIFVEFGTIAAAVKAVVDLNGRFFGGRVVKASFYDPQKFKRFELTCDD